MKQDNSIIYKLQNNELNPPGSGLRDRIFKSAEQGVSPPYVRSRIAVYPLLIVILTMITLSVTAVTAVAAVRHSWRDQLNEILQDENKARDEGYITYFYPLEFYLTEEMREQQRRVAEIDLLLNHPDLKALDKPDPDVIKNLDRNIHHWIDSLELDLTRELDDVDFTIIEAFSGGSFAAVRFNDTPLLLGPSYAWLDRSKSWIENPDIVALLSAGTHVVITPGPRPFHSYIITSFDPDIPVRAWHVVEVVEGEYKGRTGWLPNYLLEPSEYADHDFGYDPNHDLIEIVHPERGSSFSMRISFYGRLEMQYDYLPAEEIAIIAADAVYEKYGFCIDGLDGYLFLVSDGNISSSINRWSVGIYSEEHTKHSEDNALFHMIIDPVTGSVRNMTMNTPETPFIG